MGDPDSEGSIILPGHDVHVLFSGQIWKTEDMKMSVPRQAVMEEPSTEPLSPRGTCLEILTHVVLLYPSSFALAPGLQLHVEHQSLGKYCQPKDYTYYV